MDKIKPFEEPADVGQVGDILTRIQSHYWTKVNKEMEAPNMALMAASWHRALTGLSMRAIESALDEWVTHEEWPPQASDLRRIAIKQGAVIYDPQTAAYMQEIMAENAKMDVISLDEFFKRGKK